MKPKQLLLLLTLLPVISYGQEKIYYDIEGVGTNEDNASYYRVMKGDSAKDYYLSGEIAGLGIPISVDKKNDNKTLWRGKRITYYKAGNIKAIDVYNSEGKADSVCTSYYESGKPQRVTHYKNGLIVGKFYNEWDEFGKEEKVFQENFDKGNIYDWPLNTNAKHSCKIHRDTGLYMESYTGNAVGEAINLPLDQQMNYSIETAVRFVGGNKDAWHGLIWGFKDWDNYCFFLITANGHFSTGAMIDGLEHYSVYDKYSQYVNQGKDVNTLKVFKGKSKIAFSINNSAIEVEAPYLVTEKDTKVTGSVIGSAGSVGSVGIAGGTGTLNTRQVTRKYIIDNALAFGLKGNYMGFMIEEGEPQRCTFNSIRVRQRLDTLQVQSDGSDSTRWRGQGSGFFIDTGGYIATNYHVVNGASEIRINALQDGDRTCFKAKVIAVDKVNDLAVLKVTDEKYKHYKSLPYTIKSETSDVATQVFTLGFPMASILGAEVKFTDGTISSKTGPQGKVEWYQISVPTTHGNSGGPLFDYDGNVVGITNAGFDNLKVVDYAIKSNYLRTFLESLPEKFALPKANTLAAKPLTEKIKILSDYVVMIQVR